MLVNIPRFEGIAEAIAYQEKRFDGGGIPGDGRKGAAIPLIARILKVVLDFNALLTTGKTAAQAVEIMRCRQQWYDPDVLAALEAEIMSVKEGFVIRSIGLSEIMPGMELADDIKDSTGVVLISKGHEITEVLKLRLFNYARFGTIVEPIKILESLTKSIS